MIKPLQNGFSLIMERIQGREETKSWQKYMTYLLLDRKKEVMFINDWNNIIGEDISSQTLTELIRFAHSLDRLWQLLSAPISAPEELQKSF